MGIVNGLKQLLKSAKNSTKNSLDHFWLGEEGQKAIRDEVEKKYKDSLSRVQTVKDAKAANIKELDDKYKASIDELQKKQETWNTNYNSARDSKKQEMDKALADWNKNSSDIKSNLTQARKEREDYINNYMSDLNYDNTVFIDTSGKSFIIDPLNNFTRIPVDKKWLNKHKSYDTKFIGNDGKLINLFDDNSVNSFTQALTPNSQLFNYIISKKNSVRNAKEYKQLDDAVQNLETEEAKYATAGTPKTFDEAQFAKDYEKINGSMPTGYEFNGKFYKDQAGLDSSYNSAIKSLKDRRGDLNKRYSAVENKRDAEIAQRIQDAKDINKAKVALGLGTAGALAGATYAAFSGDDNSNTKPASPTVTPQTTEGIETQFEHPAETDSISGISPRDQEAALADMAFKAASESDDTPAETHLETPELAELSADDIHTNEGIGTRRSMNEGLFSVIKALQDPHQANAVADYIYSRYGNDPELQQLGWRAWLNKYYGDALKSQMNLDASGYNGMHVSGGL